MPKKRLLSSFLKKRKDLDTFKKKPIVLSDEISKVVKPLLTSLSKKIRAEIPKEDEIVERLSALIPEVPSSLSKEDVIEVVKHLIPEIEEDTPEEVVEKVNTSTVKVKMSAIEGLDEKHEEIYSNFRRRGGAQTGGPALIPNFDNSKSKTLTYNTDGTVNMVTDSSGTKTMVWSGGVLTALLGTGVYKSKSFTYSGGQLISVTVS